MEGLNELGRGLREKTYERALCHEFELQEVGYVQQAVFPVFYKEKKIDGYIPDLVVKGRIVVEINFKKSKLEWKRVVLSEH